MPTPAQKRHLIGREQGVARDPFVGDLDAFRNLLEHHQPRPAADQIERHFRIDHFLDEAVQLVDGLRRRHRRSAEHSGCRSVGSTKRSHARQNEFARAEGHGRRAYPGLFAVAIQKLRSRDRLFLARRTLLYRLFGLLENGRQGSRLLGGRQAVAEDAEPDQQAAGKAEAKPILRPPGVLLTRICSLGVHDGWPFWTSFVAEPGTFAPANVRHAQPLGDPAITSAASHAFPPRGRLRLLDNLMKVGGL